MQARTILNQVRRLVVLGEGMWIHSVLLVEKAALARMTRQTRHGGRRVEEKLMV